MQPWIDLFRSLGEALLEVWRAELATLQDDLSRSGRHLGVALGLFGAAVVLLFWTVGLLLFVLIALLPTSGRVPVTTDDPGVAWASRGGWARTLSTKAGLFRR